MRTILKFAVVLACLIYTSCDSPQEINSKPQELVNHEAQNEPKGIVNHEAQNEPIDKPSKMPEFTWDTLPLYMHVRKAEAFDEREIQYLSTFPLICLEKTTGMRSYKSTEEGSIRAAEAIKKLSPNSKVLYYRNVFVHYPFYEDDKKLALVKRPFLRGQKGEKKLVRKTVEAYDLANPDLRSWWVTNVTKVLANPAIDGLFLDGNIKVLEPKYLKKDLSVDQKEEIVEGYRLMMEKTKSAIGEDKLMIANIIRARFKDSGLSYMNYFDGSYLENFEKPIAGMSREDYLAQGIEAVQKAARSGKIIAMTLGLGEQAGDKLGIDDSRKDVKALNGVQERFEYCMALFLICAEKYSYVYIHDGYDMNRNPDGSSKSKVWLKDFPEYKKALGPPKGPAIKAGYVYTREFEHLKVEVDISQQKARLQWF
ncbi:putative glycoside hydrolase [Lentisphaera profundi]|uniref:Glycoside hydrolase n=1 Tax=Lentisphaera profundi TaxID=1658616 RepID=A0ABY7W057_9BACT|nr:putative glycoside hydrolase [Lentisphaera profundi]WDE97648.1 putative glycoside hydrolase [Lentisphaera profundi]